MKKNRIRLTESQLHRVIKESVTKILKEFYKPNFDGSELMTIGPVLDNEEEALEWLQLGDFSEYEAEPQTMQMMYIDFIDSNEAEGIDLYYDIRGNYYFFALAR